MPCAATGSWDKNPTPVAQLRVAGHAPCMPHCGPTGCMYAANAARHSVVLQPCKPPPCGPKSALACHHVVLQPCMPLCGLTALHATMWSYSLACHSVVLQPCTPVNLQKRAKLCHHVVLSWHATVWSYSLARLSTCRHVPSYATMWS